MRIIVLFSLFQTGKIVISFSYLIFALLFIVFWQSVATKSPSLDDFCQFLLEFETIIVNHIFGLMKYRYIYYYLPFTVGPSNNGNLVCSLIKDLYGKFCSSKSITSVRKIWC